MLLAEFPEEILDNPAFSLLQLVDPNPFASMTEEHAMMLARHTAARRYADRLAAHESLDVLAELISNPGIPLPLLLRHATDPSQPEPPPAQLSRQLAARQAQAGVKAARLRAAAARNPSLPGELLRRYLESGTDALRMAAAQNTSAPPALMELMRRAGATEGLSHIGPARGKLTEEEVTELASGGVWPRRLAARYHEPLPAEIFERLSRDEDTLVRAAVAWNPALPEPLLRELAADEEPPVREKAGASHAAPPDVLERLASDPVEYVRKAVARNPGCPPALLRALGEDGSEEVRKAVAVVLRERGL